MFFLTRILLGEIAWENASESFLCFQDYGFLQPARKSLPDFFLLNLDCCATSLFFYCTHVDHEIG